MIYETEPNMSGWWESHGQFVAMLPYLEQQPSYDAYELRPLVYHPANYTILGVGLKVLFCPSDPEITDLESEYVLNHDPLTAKLRYTSYAGNIGTWNVEPLEACTRRTERGAQRPGQRHLRPDPLHLGRPR